MFLARRVFPLHVYISPQKRDQLERTHSTRKLHKIIIKMRMAGMDLFNFTSIIIQTYYVKLMVCNLRVECVRSS